MRFELALATVEIRRPRHEAALEPLLDGRDGLGQLDAGALGLPLDGVATLLGEPSLLLAELVARVRPLACQEPLELQLPILRLHVDEARKVRLRGLPEGLCLLDPFEPARECEKTELGDGRGCEPTRGEEQRVR